MYVCAGWRDDDSVIPSGSHAWKIGSCTMAVVLSEFKAGVAADGYSAHDHFWNSSSQNSGIPINSPTPSTHGLAWSYYR